MKDRIEAIIASGWTVQFFGELNTWRGDDWIVGPGCIISGPPTKDGHIYMIEESADDRNPYETLDQAFDRAYAKWEEAVDRIGVQSPT